MTKYNVVGTTENYLISVYYLMIAINHKCCHYIKVHSNSMAILIICMSIYAKMDDKGC